MFGSCIKAETMALAINKDLRVVMSCQSDGCNSPSLVIPKLSKSILCSDGFYAWNF